MFPYRMDLVAANAEIARLRAQLAAASSSSSSEENRAPRWAALETRLRSGTGEVSEKEKNQEEEEEEEEEEEDVTQVRQL